MADPVLDRNQQVGLSETNSSLKQSIATCIQSSHRTIFKQTRELTLVFAPTSWVSQSSRTS